MLAPTGTPTSAFSTTGPTISVPRPEGLLAGDQVLIAMRAQSPSVTTVTIPGFSRIGVPFSPANSASRAHGFYIKDIADPDSEPASYDVTVALSTGTSRMVAVATILRGGESAASAVVGFGNAYGGVDPVRTAQGYAVSESPALTLVQFGCEATSGNSHIHTAPDGYTKVADVATAADTVGSRTYVSLWSRSSTDPVPPVTVTWASASGTHAETVSIVQKQQDQPEPVGLPVELGDGSTAYLSYLEGGERKAPASVRLLLPGFADVDHMLATPGATWAHRGGSTSFPEMSEWAYDQCALHGYGALEFSAQRTSDGWWFGLHDNSLERTSPGAGAAAPSTYTRAQVEALANSVAASGGTRPYWGLVEFLEKWTPTHVVIADPKNAIGLHNAEFLDVLDAHGGPEKIVVKFSGVGSGARALALAAAARGYETWGYFYAADASAAAGGNGNLQTFGENWTILGMSYGASQAVWDEVLAFGKPTVAHIAASQANYDMGILRGADMVQCANVLGIRAVGAA